MKRLMQLICCAALAGCSGADEPATVKVPPRVPDVAPETPRPPVERPDVEDPEAPIARPGPGGVAVDQDGEGRADLRPEATSDPNGRPRRRLNVDQLADAVLQVSDGIGWYERQGNTDVDLFAQLASTLGKPDYIQNTEEDLEPTILFQKFLGDAARSVCARMIERDLATIAVEMDAARRPFEEVPEGLPTKTVMMHVTPLDTIDSNPGAIDDNLRALLLRFHGKVVSPQDDVALANWRWLLHSSRHVAEPAEAWLATCVAMISHPDFYTY